MFPTGFRPLLADKADLDALTFPLIASPKIDGIRCLTAAVPVGAPVLYSRTLKAIPNAHAQTLFAGIPAGLDGELLTYTNGQRDDFNTIQSKIMRRDGTPDVRLHVFDVYTSPKTPYAERLLSIEAFAAAHPNLITEVETATVGTIEELMAFERDCVDLAGWEGIMVRRPAGPYKFGRSTAKEGILLKVKRFEDDEAVITGTVERQHNGNEATKDAFGRTKRSSHAANKTGLDTLGAIQATWRGVSFEIGTGMDDATRADLWSRRQRLPGEKVTFKYQGVGSLGAPRFPVFVGIRRDI